MIEVRELAARAVAVLAALPGDGTWRRILPGAAAASVAVLAACDGDTGDMTGGLDGDGAAAEQDAPPAGDRADGAETEVALATFTPQAPAVEGEGAQGRLPAAGDLAIYIAATELFPGTARIDPAIENPYAGDARAIEAGERHFAAFNCAGCHAPLGGGGMGPPLSDTAWIYGGEPAQIYLSIMHGRPEGMPAWSSMLPRKATWELVAYIDTLDEIDDYAAELGFESHDPPGGSQGGGDGAGTTDGDEASTGGAPGDAATGAGAAGDSGAR